MYHGDLIGSLAARAAGLKAIAWSLHNLKLDPRARGTRWSRDACARLSHRLPRVILSCSQATAAYHVAAGYDASRMQVIPNGFDTDRFKPDAAAREALRRELDLAADASVVLHLGRLDPLKNHAGFLRAAAQVVARRPEVRFVMAGNGVTPQNESLGTMQRELGLDSHVRMIGPRSDVPALLAGADVLLQTSTSEAFPMALGEAMSCGVPCVATDVGDSALIVGAAGAVVPPGNDVAAADAVLRLLALTPREREALSLHARQHVLDQFDIRLITRRYEAVYLNMTGGTLCAA
jgi:glycosyltransferase involved in cell wall biosynthesis